MQSFYQPSKINIVNRLNWIIYSNYHRFNEKKNPFIGIQYSEVFITVHIEILSDDIVFCQQPFYHYAQSTNALAEKSFRICNGSMEDKIFGCGIKRITFYINQTFQIIILLVSKTDYFINPFVFLAFPLYFSILQLPIPHTR